ncbi:meiosis inhibitor protein 1 isoform X2 [Paramormyrops kingsleyae]|uniref:meiosis inhibitor protein 1 isoform X2 n=1 Tax=Paramormyrops kingsleyae TaxID=1676925 RepID=UPI003B979722
MSCMDIFYEKVHQGHDPRWSVRAALPGGRVTTFCVACVMEVMENEDASSVRKSVALVGVSEVLRGCPEALKQVLLQDHRVSLHFVNSLLGMLQSTKEPFALEQVIQVLVHLLLELQSEQCVQYVLEEVQTQLCDRASLRESLPTFNFLGKLLDAMPALPQTLVAHHVSLVEQLSMALLPQDEALKASVCYVFHRVWVCVGAAQALPPALRDRVCIQVLHTLHHACSPQLTINCLGFLKEVIKMGDIVSLLMNLPTEREPQLILETCCLPLVLKKLLLSGDESLQVASAQCIAAVLVHSPSQYCPAFIQADIPEFLCERLCSRSEVLLWSVYSCLLLMTEDPLFFSQCHSVYGIEPLVRSLKEALTLTSVEVQKQGLMLLTEILDRQPVRLGLFPSALVFASAVEVVLEAIASPCLQVAMRAASAATALLRLNHQSSPVQYRELKKVVEAVMDRCKELPLPTAANRRASTGAGARGQSSAAGAFLLQALTCFQVACRLAEQCAGVPGMEENAFTAPDRPTEDNTLGSFCQHLLRYCDTACIPVVTRHCERAPSPSLLQPLFIILCCQFSVLPTMMPRFCAKLASSGFFGFTLKHKAAFCAGNRNPALNAACAEFLQRLSVCLLAQLEGADGVPPPDGEDVLRRCLPSLCSRPSDWSSLLREASAGLRATQYGLLMLFYLALRHGDRLLPDPAVFSGTLSVLCLVQEQGDEPTPLCILRAALYLLSVTQDGSPELASAPLLCLRKALSRAPGLQPLYTHSPALLRFIFRYPELAESFGAGVLELWFTHGGRDPAAEGAELTGPDRDCDDVTVLLPLMGEKPTTVLTLLGLVCRGESPLAHRALQVLSRFLQGQPQCDTAILDLRPRLLQVLQRLAVEHSQAELGAQDSLTLVLQLLCLALTSDRAAADMDGTDFKLLFHVSNLAAKLKPSDTQPLLLAINYLYCCLSLSPAHCADRVLSILLCNGALLEQLQTALSSSSVSLLCGARLLLSSLLTQRDANSAQVQKRISLNLDEIVQLLTLRKSQTDSLLLACSVRLLQTLLDLDLQSPLLLLTAETFDCRPLLETEAILQPLGSHRARCLLTALQGLLLQKQEFLLSVSASCLASLLGFLHRRSPTVALHTVYQPWSRFLLFSVLASGGSQLFHPAILALLSLMVHLGGERALGEMGLAQLVGLAERRGVKRLEGRAAEALKRLLTQQTMLFLCVALLVLAGPALPSSAADPEAPRHRHDANLEIYKRLFETKRKDQLNALKNLVELNDINQQYKIIDIMLKGLFKVLEDSRAILTAANMQPDDPFPLDDKIKEAYSHVLENTAFFGDVALRFPRIVHHYYDRNADWEGLVRWGLHFCNLTGVFAGGAHQHVLTLMSQELGITEKSPDFINPYRTERDDMLHTAEAFQKILREEEKRRRKEEKRKEIRKGPRISRSRTEL